jgi:hypothetical protein
MQKNIKADIVLLQNKADAHNNILGNTKRSRDVAKIGNEQN